MSLRSQFHFPPVVIGNRICQSTYAVTIWHILWFAFSYNYRIIKFTAKRNRVEYIMFQLVFLSVNRFSCVILSTIGNHIVNISKINVMNLSTTWIGIRYDFVKISKKFDLHVRDKNKWCHIRWGRLWRFLYSSCRKQRVDILHRCLNFFPNDSLKIIMYHFLMNEFLSMNNVEYIICKRFWFSSRSLAILITHDSLNSKYRIILNYSIFLNISF